MSIAEQLPMAWREAVLSRVSADRLAELDAFLESEKNSGIVLYPPECHRFSALDLVAPDEIKAVILGQDPYHGEGQSHGLAFSVPGGLRKLPPSLKNIFKELSSDCGVGIPQSGSLEKWAERGVLLLNTVLSVRAHDPNSHKKRGWEELTGAVIEVAAAMVQPKVFILWGASAGLQKKLITGSHNFIIESVHPSPLSVHRGFFGSRPFSRCNEFLKENGIEEINWKLETELL